MRSVLAFSLVAVFAQRASAQSLELPVPSPKARADQRVGLTDLSIEWSSPGVKGRTIWGGLVPYDQVWRTGANAATKLTASKELTIGGKKLAAGSYALYTIPGKQSWTVILSTSVDAWGSNGYDAKNDVVRMTVKPEAIPHRERLAFIFSNATDYDVRLDLEWEKVRIPIKIQVDTKAHADANIQAAVNGAWRPHFASARWLLDSNGDLDKALEYVDASIGIKPTWWNHWVKAQILAKKGRASEAVAVAEKAQSLGKGDQVYEDVYKGNVSKAISDWKKRKS
jgi:hypothetical protein